MDDSSQHSRDELTEKFDELEQRWKTEGSPDGLQNVLNIFGISSTEDFVPENVANAFEKDWKSYCRIRRELENMDDDEVEEELPFFFCSSACSIISAIFF